MIETEQRVLDMFTREFTKRNDLGREYFEGDSSAMLIAMHNFMAFRLSQAKPEKIKAHLFKNPAEDEVPRPTCEAEMENLDRDCQMALNIRKILIEEGIKPGTFEEKLVFRLGLRRK